MDKRKGIILAIVLFLIIGLGTFVFAGGSDNNEKGQRNNTNETNKDNENGQNVETPEDEEEEGENEGEGGNNNNNTNSVAGGGQGQAQTPDVDAPNAPTTDNRATLLAALQSIQKMIDEATSKDAIGSARDARTDDLVADVTELNDEELNALLAEINRVLDDTTEPEITPAGLNGSYNKKTVTITISDATDTNYTLTLNGIPVENPNLDELTEEGNYTLTVIDEAFNETTVTFTIDKTMPVVNGAVDGGYYSEDVTLTIDEKNIQNAKYQYNGKWYSFESGHTFTEEGTYFVRVTDMAYNKKAELTFTIDNTDPVLFVNDVAVENGATIYVNKKAEMTVDETNLESFTSNGADRTENVLNGSWTAANDGTYNIVVTDKAGNTTTYKIVVDKTPIEVNHLYVLNNSHNDYNVSTENRYKVIGNGQELYVEYVLKEEFASTPVITIGGKEFTMTCGTASWDDSLFKCDAHITITEDMNLIDGDVIPFTITGVLDEALNETVVDEDDIRDNASKGYSKVVYDNSAPESNWVYILNTLEGSHTVIGNEQKLLVEINVNEELLTNPVLKIGKYSVELERRANDSRYIYTKVVTIDADTMNLTHNEEIKFTVDITDVAGKTTTLDNDDVTIHEKEGYGQVVYDNVAPIYEALGILNVTHLRLNNADENANESLTVANIGDEVRVLVRFDEELDTLPTLVIGDASAEMTLMKSSAEYTYSADITLTADMFDEDGLVDFQVSGYADIAGNEGDKLNASHIKGYADYSGVTLDTTKPLMTINGESNITLKAGDDYDELGVTVEDTVDGTKVLEPVRINYSIDGELQGPVPAVDPTKPGTYKVVYEYTDAAGNVGVDANRADHDYVIRTVTVLPEGTTSLVNGVSYETLKDAVDAAKVNGGTVELVADVVNSSSIGIANNEEVTVDLNGNDISFASNQYFAVSGGTLTLTGEGTVKEGDPYYGPIFIDREIMQGSPLTINVDEGVTLEGFSGIFVDYGKADSAMNTIINFKGKINTVRDREGYVGYAIYVQGNIKNTNNYPVINIYEGSEINSVGMGIYAAGYAEWNIYGGIINANGTAIGIKSGKLNITGGTFTADGVNNIPTPAWGDGIIGSGSALQIESNDGYAQGMEINISGGEFISENAAAIYEYPDDATTSVIAFTITGGTFKSTNYSSNFVFSQSFTTTHQGFMSNITFDKENSVLDSYLAEGYILEEQADGTYKVVKG